MRSPLFRRSMLVLAVIVVLLPFAVSGAGRSLQSMYNSPVMWISSENEDRARFFEFVEAFRAHDVILVSWDGCTVDDERLDRFVDALQKRDGGHLAKNPQALFHRVDSGRDTVFDMQHGPLELRREIAIRRLQGSMIGPDELTCAVAVLTARGAIRRDDSISLIQESLESELSLGPQAYRLAGTPIIGTAIDDASVDSMVWLTIPSTFVIVVLCGFFLRSWRLVFLVLGVGFFGEQLAISLVHYSGNTMNAVLVVVSPLVFVLSASTGLHLSNYYKDEVATSGLSGAARRMLGIGWKPCLLSAMTTVAGLLSLLVSEISAVRLFAIISAVCVLLTTILMLLTLPGVAEGVTIKKQVGSIEGPSESPPFARLASFVLRNRTWLCAICLFVMLGSAVGLKRIRTSVEMFDLLSPQSRVIKDHAWFEQNVVPLVSVETVVRFDVGNRSSLFDKLRIVRDLQVKAASMPETGGTMSALTFLPAIPSAKGIGGAARRAAIAKYFESSREEFSESGFLSEDESGEMWRITSRIPAFDHVDYPGFLTGLDAQNHAVLKEQVSEDSVPEVAVTGVVPVINTAQQMLLSDLIGSFFTALVVIGVVVTVGFRSVKLGLVAMIPNVFPLIMLFGTLGWMDHPLDIGAMMTASVALGIAVDDTVHFLLSCRREVADGKDPARAIEKTILRCGPAILQTTLVCGLGLLVFALSDFGPTVRFAWMMFMLLAAALVADLIFLPALLAGPLRGVLIHAASKVQGN